MREPLPPSAIHDAVLGFLRGRDDATCPFFRTLNAWHRGKGGQAPRGCGYPRNTNGSLLGASPPFPLPTYSLS